MFVHPRVLKKTIGIVQITYSEGTPKLRESSWEGKWENINESTFALLEQMMLYLYERNIWEVIGPTCYVFGPYP
jgi:hypothetical protein